MAKEEGLNVTVTLPATDQDKDSSFISPEDKTAIANYFTTAQPFGSAIGAGVEGLARIQEFLADKQIPFTDKDVTDIFMIISQAPEKEKFTKEDVGQVVSLGTGFTKKKKMAHLKIQEKLELILLKRD
jgi:hypothetical protein